ncbi:MAG: VWA domain-containing protein [Actinobacteria bacterium]|nr:VWA domain-containing protein [Actinomycetota bacterium]
MRKKQLAIISLLIIFAIGAPLTLFISNKQQELRGKAATTISTSGPSCPNAYTDTVIIFDESESMNYPIKAGGIWKLQAAKDAANSFVDIIATDKRNKTSLISFEDTADINSQLTNNFNSVKNLINGLGTEDGDTCHQCSVIKANEEISARGRTNTKKVAILLTDGLANRVFDDPNIYNNNRPYAEGKTIDAVKDAHADNNIIFYTIGLGSNVNEDFLKKIAGMTGGKYYFSPTTNDLQKIYQEISREITRGSVNGFVFNDTNNNGDFNTGEPMLSNWNVQLASTGGTQTFTTGLAGTYTFNNLCDGNYHVREVIKSGWQQTLPSDPDGYPITIDNGSPFTDKNFGNMIAPTATLTPTPSPTLIPTPIATTPTPISDTIQRCVNGGSVSGFIWNDANNNKAYDTNENKLPNWNIDLFKEGFIIPISTTSDETGSYKFTNLCGEGTYTGTTFDIASSGNNTPVGITYNNDFLWITDYTNTQVYKYTHHSPHPSQSTPSNPCALPHHTPPQQSGAFQLSAFRFHPSEDSSQHS